MGNLNGKQIIGMVIVVVSALMVSTAQLTDLFGPEMAKAITSASSILNLILGGVVAMIGGNSSEIANVRALGLGGNTEAQKAIIASTAAIANNAGDGIGRDAGKALIDATISLPQVRTIVADSATAQSSLSDSVVSTDQVKVIENASGKDINTP